MSRKHSSRFGLLVATTLIALGASTIWMFPEFVGENAATTFSVCEQADDGTGEPRPECQASDIRYQAGNSTDSGFGFAVAAGLLDGDDLVDVVVGDPVRNRVYIFYGRGSATAAYGLAEDVLDRGVDPDASADVILEPTAGVSSFGFSLAVGGALDTTGCAPDDRAAPLLVGAPGDPGVPGMAAGSVFYLPAGSLCPAVSNPASPISLDPGAIGQQIQSPDPADDDEFGYSVALGRLLAASGDEDDVIVGARGAAAGAGRVTILPVAGGVVDLDPANDAVLEAGESDGLGEVLAVGDLDQDFDEDLEPEGDRDDLAVGAVGHPNGKVLLVQGPLAADGGGNADGVYVEDVDVELQAIVGERDGDFFGFSVAVSSAGDLLAGAIYADNDPAGDPATNVPTGIRSNAGKAYLWRTGIYDSSPLAPDASSADVVIIAHRSGDQLGFAVGFGDLDGSGTADLIVSARREDGSGLDINEIDQGTAYISYTPELLLSPADLGDGGGGGPDRAGAGGMNVLLYGGDRENDLGNEMGFSLATGNFNGDLSDDMIISSETHRRVYLVTLEDSDDDLDVAGRNIRDEDDDEDGDPDATDCDRLDPDVNADAEEIICNGIDDNCNGMEDDAPDADGDGFDACGDDQVALDCDDDDPLSYPDAPELCDGNDNGCNAAVPIDEVDEDLDSYVACTGWDDSQGDQPEVVAGDDCDADDDVTFPGAAPNENDPAGCYTDFDDDGWGDLTPAAGVPAGRDCNDRFAESYPGAAELDSLTRCMRDADLDGYGDDGANAPVEDGTDCDDDDSTSFPGAPELCDGNNNDCTGGTPDDEQDGDQDFYVACDGWDDTQGDDTGVLGGGDCDNDDDQAYPGAAENEVLLDVCLRDTDGDGYGEQDPADGIPSGTDCDDASDVTFPGAAPQDAPFNCMKDADGDDFGDDDVQLPVVRGSDCDDDDDATFTGAVEIPDDGIDQDCNDFDTVTCYEDLDGDGVGSTVTLLSADGDCGEPGESDLDTDCNDGDPDVFPGQDEIPDNQNDEDCNGFDAVTCIVDSDLDGFGTGLGTTVLAPDGSCDAADGEASNTLDCDDADGTTFPGAAQLCDGNDNTCGGVVPGDEMDVDGDDFVACSGWSDSQGDNPDIAGGDDCDESAIDTHPGAAPNESFAAACMRDADGDGFGDAGVNPSGPVAPGTDCDDSPAGGGTFPGAASIDGPLNCMKDDDGDEYGDASASPPVFPGNDCDDDSSTAGATFPGAAASENDPTACHKDADADGFGDAAPPAGIEAGTDCDDDSTGAPVSYPGATELCDGNDNDCDGGVPADELDGDGDFFVACTGWADLQGDDPAINDGDDCDDASPLTYPGAAADEPSGECMRDADLDGYGDSAALSPVTAGADCDDGSPLTFPGAAEDDLPVDACMRDADSDGYGDDAAASPVSPGADCDDTDPASFPDATEVPIDGIDQDCDGVDSLTCFEDLDGDGFGTSTTVPANDTDCDDLNESLFDTDCDDSPTGADIFPGQVEIPDNPVDEDCNGFAAVSCILDDDHDGFGTILATTVVAPDGSCDAVDGESTSQDDCDDADPGTFPGADEVADDDIDQNCNGVDTITCGVDGDQDGFGDDDGSTVPADDGSCDTNDFEAANFDDCDDNFASIFPGAAETADDGVDQDCNGADTITCTVDADQDGFGTIDGTELLAADGSCDADEGEASNADDCDDADAGAFPGADEIPADGIDQDCDGDDSLDCFVDNDRDGFGTTATVPAGDGDCDDPGESQLSNDCNDSSPAIFPGATEIPDDGIDQDCNTDDTITCFVDADQDGFGTDAGTTVLADDERCDTNQSESDNADDCDDAVAGTNPDADEILDDDVDQDCSGTDSITCFADVDMDGAGTDAGTKVVAQDGSCDTAEGESTTADDCDDGDAARFPAAVEIPGDGIDQDCDGEDSLECFLDSDLDGFGGTLTVASTDDDCDDVGESSVDTDCDDGEATVFPGATEVLGDAVDQDCNGFDSITCILDADRDGFGTDLGTTVVARDSTCDTIQGESTTTDDCDDADPGVFPGAGEIPDDGLDQDCNGVDTISCFADGDGDGFGDIAGTTVLAPDGACDVGQGESSTADDCDDADATIFPGAAELPGDEIDQDCDGEDSTTCFEDLDGDGFGTSTTIDPDDMDCTDPGESPFDTDCDDEDETVFPTADETADDGVDQDCDGADTVTCFVDADMDGVGNDAGTTVLAPDGSCDPDEEEAATSGDCDETDPNTFPGAPELCDGDANTCVGPVPDDETDPDGDGYAGCAGWDDTQGDDPAILGGGDCGATDPLIRPGIAANETFAAACMKDHDGDGYGDLLAELPVAQGTDCDDDADDTFPGAAAEQPSTCMRDRDGDGFGDATAQFPVVSGGDCDDANPETRPGAVELCDGNDNSCDGIIPSDEKDGDGDLYVACADWDDVQGDDAEILGGGDCVTGDGSTFPGAAPNEAFPTACMQDADGDDYGDLVPPAGAFAGTDCDDSDLFTFPGAAPNEAFPEACRRDFDGDGYGDLLAQPPVWVGTDCDDGEATTNPGAPEICGDGADNDCVGGDQVCPVPPLEVELTWLDSDTLSWSLPTESTGISTGYRGDMGTLRETGIYTQEPGTHPAAARSCGLAGTTVDDPFVPVPGEITFYLVTAQTISGESGLGHDSAGRPRANTSPCP